jgi:hypothetical protein
MASAVIAMQWDNYTGTNAEPGIFRRQPLSFNSRQERLESLCPGDRLWLVARCPEDQQYYFVGVVVVEAPRRNAIGSLEEARFGPYSVMGRPNESIDLGRSFPAEGILRALEFETNRPIKYGASLGQSLQSLRILKDADEAILEDALAQSLEGKGKIIDGSCGLWTKCDKVFADYFLKNWEATRRPVAFMLYDPPPAVPPRAPVFIHSDKAIRLIGRFVEARYVAGHRFNVASEERIQAREHFWESYRTGTIDAPAKADFDSFWDGQNGVRAYFLMDELWAPKDPLLFKAYGKALEWGYPTGVGYRYLSLSQSMLLLRQCALDTDRWAVYARSLHWQR